MVESINKVGIKALICSDFYKTNSCYQIIRAVVPELDNCPESGVELNGSRVPTLKTLIFMSDKEYLGAYRLSDVMATARPETLKAIRKLQTMIQPDDGCTIQFSSGTTGSPKGVLLSNHNLINNARFIGRRLDMNMLGAKTLAATQLCHSAGTLAVLLCGLIHGITSVIPAPVFDARKVLEGIIQEKCTHIFATPSLYLDMITTSQDLGLKVTTLQVAAYGGAPCSQKLALQIKETFNIRTLTPVYGMTELSSVFSTKFGDSLEQTTTTVGFVADHTEVKVVDNKGRMVPMGTPGELWVRGYNVMLKYWDDEEKTRQFISPDGWAKTGDHFVLHEDGYGRLVGRIKDVIIRIGDKIFPKEVEDFFVGHPDILEAEAFGVPDPKVGEEICVFLRLRVGVTLTEQEVRDYCKDKIAEYRIPRYIRFVKEFQRTVIGKVQKFRLLEKLQEEIHVIQN
ncbi:acyl-CoA synthetase family member 2, mitochondrial-like isoform X2 [Zootermopsis nevadensis]|nr:acyl-CoA synthetase family member 2, mitochondrial-like isoform X2 [Zootermopsis nevadensis]